METLRLIYPQWQGGIIDRWIPELSPTDAATGYYLGSEILTFLAPKCDNQLTVPITREVGHRQIQDGVMDRDIIEEQTAAALQLIRIKNPSRIVTLGVNVQ